ncbi:MAG: glycosyltransferase family 4 protein [Planctomycetaceae bacterium]|nr:glycosyltransferase family 4 protein [Planctomycetaceae bacterium]
MQLAILHYHLNPGGVTKVIANHLSSLDAVLPDDARWPVLVLCDGEMGGWPTEQIERLQRLDVTVEAVPSLGYDAEPIARPDALADELQEVLTRHGFSATATLIHAHNHSLGKNASLPGALRRLADEGYSLLLQPHDFAEDFRPANYRHLTQTLGMDDLSADVYFQAEYVHYATLNGRDFNVLSNAGVSAERLHFLPNPVPEMGELPSREEARAKLEERFGVSPEDRYVLYPVRGIRRKNVGEMVLLSLLQNSEGAPKTYFGLTLAPQNPVALPYYERWKEVVAELELPCLFNTGSEGGLSFHENLAAADCILTTSVAEGFGMVFLESWLAGRPLVGRNLPEITADFVESGLNMDSLYEQVVFPIDWVGREQVVDTLWPVCQEMFADFHQPSPSQSEVEAVITRLSADGTIDVGILSEPLQERVIATAATHAVQRQQLRILNPTLSHWGEISSGTIKANQEIIRQHYSTVASGERLMSIYETVFGSRRDGGFEEPARGSAILDAFLSLERFQVIRT